MSVLKQKRVTSKAEFVNTASQIYDETLNFLSRISARYSRLVAEDIAHLAGDTQDDHINHALCRLMMAKATKTTEGFAYGAYVKKAS